MWSLILREVIMLRLFKQFEVYITQYIITGLSESQFPAFSSQLWAAGIMMAIIS